MNWKTIIAGLFGIVAPLLAKRGILLTPETGAAIQSIFVFVCGLVANGVKFGVTDLPTTVAGLIGGAATALAAFGFDLPPDVQAGIVTISLTVIGAFARWPKWLSRTENNDGAGGAGNTQPLEPVTANPFTATS